MALGVGVAVKVAVGVAVKVAVCVAVKVAVGVAVKVAVGVAVSVAVAVGVAATLASRSAPMPMFALLIEIVACAVGCAPELARTASASALEAVELPCATSCTRLSL